MVRILQKLKGGDLRSIGRAEEVVQDILNNPVLFAEVFEGMLDDDPLVRMRSADALEKVSSKHPEYLQPFKNRFISKVSQVRQQEVRWHRRKYCNVHNIMAIHSICPPRATITENDTTFPLGWQRHVSQTAPFSRRELSSKDTK